MSAPQRAGHSIGKGTLRLIATAIAIGLGIPFIVLLVAAVVTPRDYAGTALALPRDRATVQSAAEDSNSANRSMSSN